MNDTVYRCDWGYVERQMVYRLKALQMLAAIEYLQ